MRPIINLRQLDILKCIFHLLMTPLGAREKERTTIEISYHSVDRSNHSNPLYHPLRT